MIERTDIFNINFYKKERFHGSYKGMHYRIEKYEPEERGHCASGDCMAGTL